MANATRNRSPEPNVRGASGDVRNVSSGKSAHTAVTNAPTPTV